MRLLVFLLVLGLALAGRADGQALPPPGGWPLRTVSELRAVPEPPGGLIPYRQGKLWGFADTTGRVWVQPTFSHEPTAFGQGLLLLLVPDRAGKPAHPFWGWRYLAGHDHPYQDAGTSYLINVRGEQLVAPFARAVVVGADGAYRVGKRADHLGQPELVGIEYPITGTGPGGRLHTSAITPRPPLVPKTLERWRHHEVSGSLRAGGPVRYLARRVNWLIPHRQIWQQGRCGTKRRERTLRYRHHGYQALFDERGRRLTPYRFIDVKALGPRLLAYEGVPTDSAALDNYEARHHSGLPHPWNLEEDNYVRHFGLLDRHGRARTPPQFIKPAQIGPNAVWVVETRGERLLYGVVDTLGRYLLGPRPAPISRADTAGLLRVRSARPLVEPDRNMIGDFEHSPPYPDTSTVTYRHPDGRLALPYRFEEAGAFWQGRALVRVNGRYGLIDTLGRWVVKPEHELLAYYGRTDAHLDHDEAADPLQLFDSFDSHHSPMRRYLTPPDDSVLLLVRRQGRYGLIGSRSGREVVAPCFDERPELWKGGVSGKRNGQPWLVLPDGRGFNPQAAATPAPPGVAPYNWQREYFSPPVLRVQQGYQTRGGRALWAD